MPFKFQYDKTTIQDFNRQLNIRKKALPILQNKETALRKETRNKRKELASLQKEKQDLMQLVWQKENLWNELPKLLFIESVKLKELKIVGVKVKELELVSFKLADACWWRYPPWIPTGLDILKKIITYDLTIDVLEEQIETLVEARKKTTQKVNLYEKVQIPEMEEAILKIKRFLEDKENISRAAQKIMKKKKIERREAV